MADFATTTQLFMIPMGDSIFGCYKLTGDASGTTFSPPIGAVDAAWSSNITGSTPLDIVSHSGNTITVTMDSAGVIPSGEYVHVFFVGST